MGQLDETSSSQAGEGDATDAFESQALLLNRQTKNSVLKQLAAALLRRSLTKIDLSQRGLQPSDSRLVKMALSKNSGLVSLRLSYNSLGDEGAKILADGIAQHSSLRSLDLGFNNIGDEGCLTLCLAINTHLETLYLAGNLIREKGAAAIAQRLQTRDCGIRTLYLTGNRLGPEGVQSICNALMLAEAATNGPPLRQIGDDADDCVFGLEALYLGGTAMGDLGLQAVSSLVRSSRRLRVLSLPNCDVTDPAIHMISQSIKENKDHTSLESLQLSFNSISCRGMESLMNALWGYRRLRELKLDNNQIAEHGAKQLSMAMTSLGSLETLDLGFNAYQSLGAACIMKGVADSTSLRTVSISGCKVDSTSARAIAYALAYSQTLISLDLVHCDVDSEAQRHIVAGAVSNSCSRLRELTGFRMAPMVVSLGFPKEMNGWNNVDILRFLSLMWERFGSPNASETEESAEPSKQQSARSKAREVPPREAAIVVSLAKDALDTFTKEGIEFRSRRRNDVRAPTSPIAGESIVVELSKTTLDADESDDSSNAEILKTATSKSFVAAEDGKECAVVSADTLASCVSSWVTSNKDGLKTLLQQPFSSTDLWQLHQHFFTPVVRGSDDNATSSPSSSFAQMSNNDASIHESESLLDSWSTGIGQLPMTPASEPTLKRESMEKFRAPLLKRKMSYKRINEAFLKNDELQKKASKNNDRSGSVSMMIESIPASTLPPKNKRARRNRSRVSFMPGVKAKLDLFMELNHDKALAAMRLLLVVEKAVLSGQVLPLEHPVSHLRGQLAEAAEAIILNNYLL